MERRLAAILAADLVGYSRLMGADEAGTLARLTALRKERIEPLIASHNGRVFKLMGDGILAEFASAVNAVACAVAWQRAMDGELRFRIGVNLGDIIAEDGDIHGNGVNIAARLEPLADPGGICLSGTVHAEVRHKLGLAFEDMGEQTVKNIAEPVRAFRVVLDGAAPAPGPAPRAAPKSAKPSVAVLPFDNMSNDPGQEGFADGITEDVITALSRSHSFDVTARNSTFAFKGKSPDIRSVARTLGVGYVLEGSVRQSAGRARITVQLIDAASGNHVWADRYDRRLDDEFAVQDEIAQRIASILTERIWQDVARNIGHKRPQDYGAHDHAFRAIELIHRLEPASMAQAEDCCLKALAIDPDLTYGHVGLGFCYLTSTFWGDPGGALLAKAHQHALRLKELEPGSAQTYRLLSRTHSGMGQWEEAWDCVQRALRIDPSDGDIIGNRGVYHLFHGEFSEAVTWLDKVLDLHADTPHTVDIMRYWKAMALFAAADHAAAAALLGSVTGLDFIKAELLAACHARLGQTDKARASASEVLRAYPAFSLSHVRLWKNFRNPADGQHLLASLREAGLPE